MTRLLLPAVLSIGVASIASAQASRTWVSGVGDDANPCSRTAPCKTWAGAISKTAPKGEIDALDPGGFGAVTITKAITLDGTGGFASTLVSGTNGIVVSATPNADVVILRRISINGIGTGTNGINWLNGKALIVDGCQIQNFTNNAINAAPNNGAGTTGFLDVRDTLIENNTGANSAGVAINPASGTVLANLNRVRESGGGSAGVNAVANCKVSIQDSDLGQNPTSSGVTAQQTSVEIDASSTMLTNSAFGAFLGVGGGAPTVRLTRCTITGNTTAGLTINAGSVIGYASNMIEGNAGNNSVTATHTPQ